MSTLDLSTCTGAEWLAWAAGQFPAIRNRVDLEGLAAKVDTRDAFDALDLWGSGQSEVMQAIVRTLCGFWHDTAPWRCKCPHGSIAGLWCRLDLGNKAGLRRVLDHARYF